MMSLKKELLWGGIITIVIIVLMFKVSSGYKTKMATLEQSVNQTTQTTSISNGNQYRGYESEQNEGYENDDDGDDQVTTKTTTTTATTTSASSTITAAEVAKHNSASDCWIVIDNKVLKVTSYLRIHPGGPGTMVPYCGKDASSAYHDEVKHGNNANQLLGDFLIGVLGMDISPIEVAKL